MNYYERHIGDFIKDTVALTMIEDGAYNRLMDQHYQTESPLPLEIREVYRLARATNGNEKRAVDYVLSKFWDKTPDGYTQKRVLTEIERFKEKSRKAKASADARWSHANASATHDASHMRTHSEGNALQTPVTSNQTPYIQVSKVLRSAEPPALPGQPPFEGVEPKPPKIPPCDHQAVLRLWAELLPAHPQPQKWTDTRQGYLRARWRELFADGAAKTEEDALKHFAKFFRYIGTSRFLTGRAPSQGGRPTFIAELPWVLQPENHAKIIEGKYHTED